MRTCRNLAYVVLICISQFFEVRMLQYLRRRGSFMLVIRYHPQYQVLTLWGYMRYHFGNTLVFFCLEIELHVSSVSKQNNLTFLTFKSDQEVLGQAFPICCEFCEFDLVHCCRGREERGKAFRRRHSPRPKCPSYTRSIHL